MVFLSRRNEGLRRMELLGAATQKRTFVQLQRPTPSGHVQPLPRQTLIPESRDPFANLYLVFDHSISNVRLLSSAAAMTIPENITRLHDGEEKLREESLRRIEERSDTSAHLVMIEQSMNRTEEHTSELQSLMRSTYAVFCWKKKKHKH